ncbi:MAG: hypothetical protein RSA02_06055, partial [Bacteroidales bacterium]
SNATLFSVGVLMVLPDFITVAQLPRRNLIYNLLSPLCTPFRFYLLSLPRKRNLLYDAVPSGTSFYLDFRNDLNL